MEKPSLSVDDATFFSALPGPTRFFLVRHGQSEANAKSVVQGLMDFRLDDSGRAQASALGLWLKDKGIEKIYSSPLVRASETASILAEKLGLPRPEIVGELREIDAGRFSGLSLQEAKSRFPEDFAAFERSSWEGVPDAERAELVYARAQRVWSLLREAALSGERRLLCVTHGGLLQWLVRATFGTRSWMPLLPTGNCGVFELLVEPSGGGAKLYWERINFQAPSPVAAIAPVF